MTSTPFAVSGLLTFVSSLSFGVFVLFKSRDKRLGRSWFYFALSVAGWGAGCLWMSSATTPAEGLFAGRMAYPIGVLWIAPLFYRFICTFLELERPRSILIHFGIGALFLCLVPTKLLISHSVYLWNSIYYIRGGPALYVFFVWWVGLVIYSHVLMLRMFDSVSLVKKNQIKYFFFAMAVSFLGGTTAYLPDFNIDIYPWGNFTVFLYPFMMAMAIVKHRLMDINVVVRKTLLYSLITAGLASVYAGTVTLLARLLENGPISPALFPTAVSWFANNLRLSFAYSCVGTAVFSLGFSLFVWLKGRDKAANRLWALVCISIGAWSLGLGMMVRALGERNAYLWQVWVEYPGAILIPIAFFHFVTVVLRAKSRFVLGLGYAVAVILEVLNFSGRLASVRIQPPFHFYTTPLRFYWLFAVYFAALVLYAHGLLLWKMTSAETRIKNQARYIFLGTSIGFCGGSTTFFPVFGVPIFPYGAYAVPVYIVTVSYAIFKHQLMDINVVIRRTLLYSLISAALASIYVGTITLIAYFLGGRHSLSPAYSSALAAVFITLMFNPLRHRLQSFIDRKFSRSRLVSSEQFMEFSSEVIGHERLEKIIHSMGRILDEAIHPELWMLYLRSPGGDEYLKLASASADGWPARMPLSNVWADYFLGHPKVVLSPLPVGWEKYELSVAVPLQGGPDLLGFLLLGRKQSDETYSDEDLILLRLIANQAAVAFERPKLARQVSEAFVHEVKMPLANISLPAELTFMELEDASRGTKNINDLIPGIKRRMKYIMEQASLAAQRIDAVRDFSEDGSTFSVPVELSDIIRQAVASLEGLLQKQQIQIDLSLTSRCTIVGDAAQLEIVFVNLIKNAVQAMETMPPEKFRRLRIHSAVSKTHSIIHITDTGPGVSPENKERIFQSRYSTKGMNGAGMGLFLCRQIVLAHTGTIEVLSNPAGGAKFEIQFPRVA